MLLENTFKKEFPPPFCALGQILVAFVRRILLGYDLILF
jgi:hypothetical protein